MPIEAAGILSTQLDAIERLLASSPAWQAWTDHANADPAIAADEARRSIYVTGLLPPLVNGGLAAFTLEDLIALRPFAVVSFDLSGQGFQFTSVARGQFSPQGSILVSFEDNLPEEDKADFKQAVYDFTNRVGNVVQEMQASAEDGDYPAIQNIRVRLGPRRASTEEVETKGDHLMLVLSIDVGLTH